MYSLTKIITVGNNRKISYAEYGDVQGSPVLFFHGFYSSRVFALTGHIIAKAFGVRLIAIDRPGIGYSTFTPNRILLDFPEDIKLFAEELQLKNFSILGYSAGAPYALACAYKIPQLIKKVGIVSPAIPFDENEEKIYLPVMYQILKRIILYVPWVFQFALSLINRQVVSHPEKLVDKGLVAFPKSDLAVLKNPIYRDMFAINLLETFRQGSAGLFTDAFLLTQPWNFPLQKISLPIKIWHGEEDTTMPVKIASYLHEKIADTKLYVEKNEGHFLIVHQWNKILQSVV